MTEITWTKIAQSQLLGKKIVDETNPVIPVL
jgi:hypothetical protein